MIKSRHDWVRLRSAPLGFVRFRSGVGECSCYEKEELGEEEEAVKKGKK